MASLFVIQGADQGKRFEFMAGPVALGRDNSNPVQLHDTEVSRRHAELRLEREGYRIVDLGSANGTYVNGQPVDQTPLQLGRPGPAWPDGHALSRRGNGGASRDLTGRGSTCWPGAAPTIARPSSGASRRAKDRGSCRPRTPPAGWLARTADEPVGHVPRDPGHQQYPRYRRALAPDPRAGLRVDRRRPRRDPPQGRIGPARAQGGAVARARPVRRADDDLAARSSTTSWRQGQGVITTDAPSDKRFSPAQSIVDFQIREAICVPVQGRHTTLGVLYADIQAGPGYGLPAAAGRPARTRFTQDQLMLMVAIGHQAGLAIENTQFL